MIYFLQGLTLGFAYLAPIGVQNMFVINTGLTQPRKKAYLTALIVIFFDITLAFACFYGIGALMNTFEIVKLLVLSIGSIAVMMIGIKLIAAKVSMEENKDVNIPLLKVIAMACVVTWFNPQALIDGSLMLGAFRASLPPEYATVFIIGVAIASCLWFLSITTITSFFRNKFTDKILRMINIMCGIVIFAYGLKLGCAFLQMTILQTNI